MQPIADVDTVLFDAYGTLFDVLGNWSAPEVVQTMREKQLQYSWLQSLMGGYRDFPDLTRAALEYALEAHDVPGDVDQLMHAQLSASPFEDARPALDHLKGRRLGILSNGHPEALARLVHNAHLDGRFEWLISAHDVGVYKPSPRVYRHALDVTGADRRRLLFVSSNAWDAIGAANFGLRVAWVNRTGAPRERVGGTPEVEVLDLLQLCAMLEAGP